MADRFLKLSESDLNMEQTWWLNDKTITNSVITIVWFLVQADQLFAKAKGWSKQLICETLTNHNILLNLIQLLSIITIIEMTSYYCGDSIQLNW